MKSRNAVWVAAHSGMEVIKFDVPLKQALNIQNGLPCSW